MRSHRHQGKYKERKVRRSQDNNIFFQGDQTGHELCSVHQHPHPLYFSYIVCCFFFYRCMYHSKVGYITTKSHFFCGPWWRSSSSVIAVTYLPWATSLRCSTREISDFFLRPSKFLQRWFRAQVSVCSPFGKGEHTVKKCKVMFWQVAFDSLAYRRICLSECLHINCKSFESVRIFLCNFCIAIQIDGVVWWCRFYVSVIISIFLTSYWLS